jgi:hypothetical protein
VRRFRAITLDELCVQVTSQQLSSEIVATVKELTRQQPSIQGKLRLQGEYETGIAVTGHVDTWTLT